MSWTRALSYKTITKAQAKQVASRTSSRNPGSLPPFAAPASFASALAIGLVIGAPNAAAVCTPTTPGQVLSCSGASPNPTAFTATGNFNVTIEGTPNAAVITRNTNAAALQITGGNFTGVVNMGAGASITTDEGGGSRHGLVITSAAAGTSKTYTIGLDGSIVPADADGDALRLEGNTLSIFNVTLGETALLGGGTGDDGIIVTGAGSLLLNNYGGLSGGSGQPTTGGEGINVGNGSKIAAGGIVLNNEGNITGLGNGTAAGAQAINIYGLGAVTITNSEDGDIVGATEGIRVQADGAVTITNEGHIEGNSRSGIEVFDATTVDRMG